LISDALAAILRGVTKPRPPRAPDCQRWSGNASDTLAFYDRGEREYGGILATHVWGLPVWLVFDPAAIEEVLVQKHRASRPLQKAST
jgi:hypothetical protein